MTISSVRIGSVLMLSTILLLAVAGCSDDPFSPYEPEVSNEAGTFELQATGVQGVSLTRDYAWSSEGAIANVNQATTVDQGRATLRILDAGDSVVYERDLAANGTFETDSGTGSGWTIRIILTDYSGTVNFRVESP